MRGVVLAIAIALGVACTDAQTIVDPDATALEIIVQVPPGLGVDRLQIAAVDGAFAAGALPDEPRALIGEQSAVVLLPEALDGTELIVRVDGLAAGAVVASGGARATVRARSVERVIVSLGEPAVCGDGIVAPLIEPCDDRNAAPADGCSETCTVEPGFRCTSPPDGPSLCRPDTFDVAQAASTGLRFVEVTFSDPPDPVQALSLASYSVPGLTLSEQPFLVGNTVRLTTSAQAPIDYNVVVSGVTRARDGAPLSSAVAAFVGRKPFDVVSARSTGTTRIVVTFSEAPELASAQVLASYAVPGLVLSGTPTVDATEVTITTSVQASTSYTVSVDGVRREGDGEALDRKAASFTGANGFDVIGAVSLSNRKLAVTFNAPPNPAQAAILANYSVAGLGLTGTPVVDGSTVTLDTATQSPIAYTVAVGNVTRADDGRPLTSTIAPFVGVALAPPTVLVVQVLATTPDNGATFYNTGTAVVRLTGTQFATVPCPGGVRLGDGTVHTQATSCTVDSDTQITATFPAGIATNGVVGWPVIVTNAVGANAASDALVVRSGLLLSEVRMNSTGHEFVELYNPTASALDVAALQLHFRKKNGMDTVKPIAFVRSSVPSHGFFLIASDNSAAGDAWFSAIDATYVPGNNALESNGGVYISTSATAQQRVLDKLGWGSQSAGGFEGAPMPNLAPNTSFERKPAGGGGHAIDTDDNAADFNPATATPTPRGALSAPEP